MKRLLCLLVILSVAATFYSCEREEDFDEILLIGKWKQISGPPPVLYYRYDTNGGGVTWNPDEGYNESNGQKFTWKLVQSELTQIHLMEVGSTNITFIFIVTELTATTLKYKDQFDSWSFTRI